MKDNAENMFEYYKNSEHKLLIKPSVNMATVVTGS